MDCFAFTVPNANAIAVIPAAAVIKSTNSTDGDAFFANLNVEYANMRSNQLTLGTFQQTYVGRQIKTRHAEAEIAGNPNCYE